jgi:hypothetical protein
MTPPDVPPDEMGSHPFDDELDRMLSGTPGTSAEADALGVFVRDLQAAFATTPTSEDVHVAAMTEASQLLADKGDPAVMPVSNADAPATQASRLPKQRRNEVKDRNLKQILLRVLVPTFATLVIFSGMAFAGVLPGPLQGAADTVGSWVGLGDDDQGGDATVATTDDDQGESDATDDDQGDVESDDQGEDGDHQGEDADDQGDDEQDATDDDQGGSAESDDDQGEDGDHQGEDADDQGEDEQDATDDDQGEESSDDDQGGAAGDDQGDSEDDGGDQGGAGDDEGDGAEDGDGGSQDGDGENAGSGDQQ